MHYAGTLAVQLAEQVDAVFGALLLDALLLALLLGALLLGALMLALLLGVVHA